MPASVGQTAVEEAAFVPGEPLPIPQEAEDKGQFEKEGDKEIEVFGPFPDINEDENKDANEDETCSFRF